MSEQIIDIGDRVICDDCGKDYTRSDATGGLLFGSRAYCPDCAPKLERAVERYNEQHLIRGRCPDGMTFREWVLSLRGGDNTIHILTGDEALEAMRLTEDCATSRLNSAAPTLLSAAQALLEWYDRDGSVGGLCDPMEELRAAIAAVVGEDR